MKLKTKLTLGIGFLFIVILVFGVLSIISINILKSDSAQVLKNNHETLMYCNNILKALDEIKFNRAAIDSIEANLSRQEKNITEPGEKEATELLRKNFEELKANPNDSSNYPEMRQSLQFINYLNQQAIMRKNEIAETTAQHATTWLTIIFSVLTLIAFTLVVNFPSIISKPVRALADGISEIANKNYKARIRLNQKDEFGTLANAFNQMAEKLQEYDNSSLAKLLMEKKRIETLINNMHDPVIGLDENKRILFANNEALKITGLKEHEILGKPVQDIAVANDLVRSLIKEMIIPEEKNLTEKMQPLKIYADNKESYFEKEIVPISITPTGENEKINIGNVIVLRNITPFKELDFAKTNFIATVSHELKTPIASIKMSLQLLDNETTGNLNNEQHELLDSIKDDTNRLLKITGELLNMTQVESGNIQLALLPSDAKEMMMYAVNANRMAAENKHIKFDLTYAENLPQVIADSDKTTWVLNNLLSNAIRHSRENETIYLRINLQNRKILFTVKDTGHGIAQEYKQKIFDRYFRVPGSQKEGTGLGLAISKEFIEAQGGTITVESEIGVGSTFTVTLNAAQ
ncbi:cell wall metabolism sensor histidine kinase WalK [Panacibacter ginsenosidivorans]|uniref:histidine kinase n=1 Tax=Panacibacter ginsenosidivorans TaxID=1813871 RepID=A0A5B8V572_9BACT|nr:ATP-binding protein [Panacibacter ginsenosidivorans]QEC66329.1 cell wall metabolism sensor histidine kinase WalK [Panacibacter ginsenosidivorans]